MNERASVFVFDADDTLWMTEWQYSQAYANFFAYLYEILGDRMPNLHLVRERFFEIESQLYDTYGVKRGRVEEAMVQTYRKVCDSISWRFGENVLSEAHETRIREIGDMPFDYTRLRYLPHVQETLSTLKDAGARLCLLTSYDTNVFPHKAAHLGIERWFPREHIRVVEHKKCTQDFITVSGWDSQSHPSDKQWYAVGNGESDIKPALLIAENWRGIHIPQGSTSAYFKEDSPARGFATAPLVHDRVKAIRDFCELLPAIDSPR